MLISWIIISIIRPINSSAIRQKGESQNGCFKETKHAKCSEKTNIFYPLIRTRTRFALLFWDSPLVSFDRENFILGYFFVDRVDLLKIVELNADNSSKMCLDKISMLLDTSAPLKRINVYKLKFKSKSLITSDNLRLTKINICEKEIT